MATSATGVPDDDAGGLGPHRGNRYGRSEAGRRAILHAADDLVMEKGFDAVTMEAIAQRAGVGKQTIYRWWRTKADVLLESFLEDAREDLEPPDHGDLGDDLRDHLGRLARFLSESDQGVVFRALVARAQLDPDFAAEFRSRALAPQRERTLLLLRQAVERGQLSDRLDLSAELEKLVGPLFYRVLVTAEPVGPEITERLVDDLLSRRAGAPGP